MELTYMNDTSKKPLTLKEILITIYQTILIGLKNTLKTGWFIIKIVIPITFIIKLLQHLDLIPYITFLFEPLMKLFGLPGDAALVLLSSYFINIYAGLVVMANFTFSIKHINILAMMILFAHSLLIETSVIKSLGIPRYKQLIVRLGASFLTGILLNFAIGPHMSELVIGTGSQPIDHARFSLESFPMFLAWFQDLMIDFGLSVFTSVTQIMIIIGLVLIGVEFLKVTKIFDHLNNLLYQTTKFLGIRKEATTPLFVGLFVGITYGAGTILLSYKNNEMNNRDVLLVSLFLCLAHALVEDTLLFAKMGANVLLILFGRLLLAVLVVFITSKYTKNLNTINQK